MGWEDQGRQYHGWFGSGTSAQAEMTSAQVAETVARGAARALAPGMQREFVAFTSRDQGQRLTEAVLPVAASAAVAGGIPAVSSSAAASVMTGLQALRLLLGLPTAALVGLGILLWPKPAGDIYRAESTPPTNKPGKGETPEDRRTGTHDRPPTGSMPIDESDWSRDHGDIKEGIGQPPTGKVSISPEGDAWYEHPDGSWSNAGNAGIFVGSGKPSGRKGKDRERNWRRDRD